VADLVFPKAPLPCLTACRHVDSSVPLAATAADLPRSGDRPRSYAIDLFTT
jgi:hypothetical protein